MQSKSINGIWGEALKILNEAGERGIRVDLTGLKSYVEDSLEKLALLRNRIFVNSGIEGPGSSKEVSAWLNGLGVDGRGSSKERLQLVQSEMESKVCSDISEWRNLRKSVSMSQNVLAEVDSKGRFHYEWLPSLKSGRLYSGIQNLSAEIRNYLLPDAGQVLVSMDWHSQELRILLNETGENELLASLDRGEDFHSKVAAMLYKVPEGMVSEIQRDRGKAVTYGIPYGQVVRGMVYRNCGLTTSAASVLMEEYYRMRPKLKPWIEEQKKKWKERGYCVVTKLGQVRYGCPEDAIICTKIQGSAADILCSAILRVDEVLKRLGGRVLGAVHDSIVISVPYEMQIHDEYRVDFTEVAKEMISTEYGVMPVVVKTGMSWGEAYTSEGIRYPALEKSLS